MFFKSTDLRFTWLPALVLALAAGCVSQQKPQPLSVPAVTLTQTHYLGDAVSGPLRGALDADALTGAIVAHVRLYAATDITSDKLESLGTATRLVLAVRDRQPMLATDTLTSASRWASSTAADAFATQLDAAPPQQVVKWQEENLVIPPGVTAAINATDDKNHHTVQILIGNAEGQPGSPQAEVSLVQSEEQAVLRPIIVKDGVTAALVIPFQPTDSKSKYLAAIVRFDKPPAQPDDTLTAMVDACREDVQRESDLANKAWAQRMTTQPTGEWPVFDAARQAATDSKNIRAAMVALAAQTGAALLRDVYLVADEAMLSKMFDDVATRVAADTAPDHSTAALAWLMDQSTLQTLVRCCRIIA